MSSPPPADDDDDDARSRCASPDPDVLEAYTALMSSLLPARPPAQHAPTAPGGTRPDVLGPVGDDDEERALGRPMTKAEKQNAKKRRRKEREREDKAEQARAERQARERVERERPVAFRLFSSCPVRDVLLLSTEEDYPIPPNPLHLPLPASASRRISLAAAESAVDPVTLISASEGPPARLVPPASRSSRPSRPAKPLKVYTTHAALPPWCVISQHPARSGKPKAKDRSDLSGRVPKAVVTELQSGERGRGKRQRSKRPRRVV